MVRLTIFHSDGKRSLGVLVGGKDATTVADLTATLEAEGKPPLRSMRAFLELGTDEVRRIAAAATATARFHLPLADVRLLSPIYDPQKVICIGMNYVDHCTEQDIPVPTEPLLFSKFASAISAPGDPLPLAPEVQKLDWEVELAIVIGKSGRRVPRDKAMEYVAGYTVAHDVSARDWQLEKNGGQWLVGKTYDGYLPLGPALVTPDELSDPHNLGCRTRVNGETLQDSNTNQMVFKTAELIEWISKFMTINPGDVICSGTPPGVGCFMKPPRFLKDGDVVDVEIDEIGTVTNKVVAEGKIDDARL